MITKNINFKNFVIKIKKFQISKKLRLLLNQNNRILSTLRPEYKYSYNNRIISKFKKSSSFTLIGMGGSILGAQAIYDFLKYKIKKDFFYLNKSVELHKLGSEVFRPDKESLDLCFTSPPYFDTEKYSDEETQSYVKFPEWWLWASGFLRKTIQNCQYGLKQNRYMLINIANVSSFNNLEEATVTIAEQEGFVHEDTYRLALSKIRGNGFKYEPIFVFKKSSISK